MAFTRKAKQTQTGGNSDFDAEAYQAWNEHIHAQHPAKKGVEKGTKNIKTKTMIGITNYIQDLGTPPAADSEWDVKPEHISPLEGEEYSQYELDYIEEYKAKGRSVDFIWGRKWDKEANKGKGGNVEVRLQTSPADNKQEYGVCVDFPQWPVNFALHPNAPEGSADNWRPMRVSLNGKPFNGQIRPIPFETVQKKIDGKWQDVGISENNLLRKIAVAAQLDEDLVSSEWDIGTLAEATCNFKVKSDLNITDDGRCFFSASASMPSAIEEVELPDETTFTVDAQIKGAMSKCELAPFTGILLDMDMEEYTDELLKMLHSTGTAHSYNKRMELSEQTIKSGVKDGKEWEFPKGVDYKTTNLCKAYTKWLAKQDKKNTNSKAAGSTSKSEESKSQSKPPPKKEEAKKSSPETIPSEPEEGNEGLDFDDEIPF